MDQKVTKMLKITNWVYPHHRSFLVYHLQVIRDAPNMFSFPVGYPVKEPDIRPNIQYICEHIPDIRILYPQHCSFVNCKSSTAGYECI